MSNVLNDKHIDENNSSKSRINQIRNIMLPVNYQMIVKFTFIQVYRVNDIKNRANYIEIVYFMLCMLIRAVLKVQGIK